MASVNIKRLDDAIENLYRIFSKYGLKPHVDGCPHCTGDKDHARIHSRPLRVLTSDDLERFAFKAMTTWGDEEDFKHFLPRLFELVVRDDQFGVNPEILIGKLATGHWNQWQPEEKNAIELYLFAVWNELLESTTFSIDTDTWLASLASSFGTVKPALSMWLQRKSIAAITRFVEFFGNNITTLMKNRKLTNAFFDSSTDGEVIEWLISPDTERWLEENFFELKDPALAQKVSNSIEQVRWLRERERMRSATP